MPKSEFTVPSLNTFAVGEVPLPRLSHSSREVQPEWTTLPTTIIVFGEVSHWLQDSCSSVAASDCLLSSACNSNAQSLNVEFLPEVRGGLLDFLSLAEHGTLMRGVHEEGGHDTFGALLRDGIV
mmetsp:Transcript_42791/g.107598  ORF Transcript_42791/g.107598 Transcript_42791/m.107598 type:complete len:124 (+) Transcript_42791:35-406(+)